MKSYLLLIQKDYVTHVHGVTVYVKEGLPFAWDLSLKKFVDLLMFSTRFFSISVLFHFSL